MKRPLSMLWNLLAVLGLIFCGLVLIVGCLYFRHAFFFKGEIARDVFIVQRPFRETYDIRSQKRGLIVEDTGVTRGWMVAGGYLYGSAESKPQYYALNLFTDEQVGFPSLRLLNGYLRERGLPELDMSKEENIVHLKYGAGRNRLYPLGN